jgi:hypothetical protein
MPYAVNVGVKVRFSSLRPGQEELQVRIKKIASVRPSWGSPAIQLLLVRPA